MEQILFRADCAAVAAGYHRDCRLQYQAVPPCEKPRAPPLRTRSGDRCGQQDGGARAAARQTSSAPEKQRHSVPEKQRSREAARRTCSAPEAARQRQRARDRAPEHRETESKPHTCSLHFRAGGKRWRKTPEAWRDGGIEVGRGEGGGEFMLGGRRRGNVGMFGLNLTLKQASLLESTVA